MPDPTPHSHEGLVQLLAPTLGEERAEKSVAQAATSIGVRGKAWTAEDTARVLDAIAYAGGDAGVAAAHARAKLVARDPHGESPTPSGGIRKRAAQPAKRSHYTRRDLAEMLSRTLGQEKAAEVVNDAARVLALADGDLASADALRVLERLARADGMVGVAARFAKTRVLLGS